MKNTRSLLFAAVLLCLGLGTVAGRGAAYLKLGDIKGEATDSEHRDWMIVESMNHGITRQSDPASGLPTGKRQHKPVTITKPVDKATPLLMGACVNGQLIPMVRMEFVRPGEQDRYYQVIMKNVLVTSYQTGGSAGQTPTESFSLNYEEIKWTYTIWDDTDIVHVDQSYRWNLIHEAGEADTLPVGSFRLAYGAARSGTGEGTLLLEWEGFEEFHYIIKTSATADGTYDPVETFDPLEDGKQELELPIGAANRFIQIEKVRESIIQQ